MDSRPVFTGDVFDKVPVPDSKGVLRKRTVMVVQHPCSMRVDGVNLANKLLVAEVSNRKPLDEAGWSVHYSLMPLPDLRPSVESGKRHQAADFDNLHMANSADLTERVACLAPVGLNLLLQRWVHFSSRVVVPTWQFHQTIEGEYEEADIIEDWCLERDSLEPTTATKECVDWLRDSGVEPTVRNACAHPRSAPASERRCGHESDKFAGTTERRLHGHSERRATY